MYQGIYRIAHQIIAISSVYQEVQDLCKDYTCRGTPDLYVNTTLRDIAAEKEKSRQEDLAEGIPVREFPESYLETLAVYRKIAEYMLEKHILLFHGSVVAVDGKAFLFTAKSGTGKSTHTRLWRELLGERAIMVNDDKPLLETGKDQVTVYGTPWDGKHHLSTNIQVPLEGICILNRGEENKIRKISREEAYPMLLQQSFHPADGKKYGILLEILDSLGKNIPLYSLQCNMELDAARLSFHTMFGKEERMRLRNEFITHQVDGSQVMVSTETRLFSGLVRSNETAAFIIDCLKEETTEEKIVDKILEEYDVSREIAARDVKKILLKLREIHAIHE